MNGATAQGILNCYKPRGLSSRAVVDLVQRRLRPAKVGHAGTLDPLAEGVLVLAIGAASRLIPYLHLYPKSYAATFLLGCESASGDLECEVIRNDELPIPTPEALHEAALALTGTIEQVPPLHSAVKVNGRRAYDAARRSETLELRPRQVQIHRLSITEYAFPALRADIECGTGTYIRSLGMDWARQVGSTAVMSELVRTAVGPFPLASALRIEPHHGAADLLARLQPLEAATGMLPRVTLTDEEVCEIQFGRPIGRDWPLSRAALENGVVEHGTLESVAIERAAVDRRGSLRAILERRGEGWGPKRVFPPPPREEPPKGLAN